MEPKPNLDSAYFEPGSAVEVSIDDNSFRGSWFSGTLVCRIAAGSFMVEYHNLMASEQNRKPLREVVSLHQLRPLPPQEDHREFKSGDKVEAFHNNGWWEGHVTEDLGNRRFGVHFRFSDENMVIPKEHLRTHRKWINHNWILPITNHKVLVEGKETEEKWVVKMKGQSGRNTKDMISELHDSVLLHIMSFMNTKSAVQTCVLSKRWKDLCKCLTDLKFFSSHRSPEWFKKFASWVLSSRDDSYSLLNFTIGSWIDVEEIDRVMEYALLHSVQQLTVHIGLISRPNCLPPLLFCCESLTSLTLSFGFNPSLITLPKSLHLPALENLYLRSIFFTATDNDCAEPFSNCRVLKNLFLNYCCMHNDARVLCISNTSLFSLTIKLRQGPSRGQDYKIALSTPNLNIYTMNGFFRNQLSSTCNLSFLREVNIDLTNSIVTRWLQVLGNVKILTLSSETVLTILRDLSSSPMRLKPPCFVRLELLKVRRQLRVDISDKEVTRVVEYLLQNSIKAKVDIITSAMARVDIITSA